MSNFRIQADPLPTMKSAKIPHAYNYMYITPTEEKRQEQIAQQKEFAKQNAAMQYAQLMAQQPKEVPTKQFPSAYSAMSYAANPHDSDFSDAQIAKMIIAGKGGYGNGAQRKQSLGQRYAAIQALVNQMLAPKKTATVVRESPITVYEDVPNVVDPTLEEIAQASMIPNLRLNIPGMLPYNDIPGFVSDINTVNLAASPEPEEQELMLEGNLGDEYKYPTAKSRKEKRQERKDNRKANRLKRKSNKKDSKEDSKKNSDKK